MYVESVVPKEDLLIWNLKDGWEPLCSFLGKEVPKEPFPHDNKTGDVEFLYSYAYRHKMFTVGLQHILKNLMLFVIKVLFGLYLISVFLRKQTE